MPVSQSDLPPDIRGWTISQFYSKEYQGKAVFQAAYSNPAATGSGFEIYIISGSVENGEQVFYTHRGFSNVGPFGSLNQAIQCLAELTEAPEID